MPWFRRRTPPPGPADAPSWPLVAVTALARDIAAKTDNATIDAELLEAQLADLVRDAGLEPLRTAAYATWSVDYDADTVKRLSAAALVFLGAPKVLGSVVPAGDRVYSGLGGFLAATAELPLALVVENGTRAEEFVRQLAAPFGIRFAGEEAADSAQRLAQIDYGALLREARRARDDAEGQLEYLRKKQEAQDGGRRRGKW